MAKKFGKFLLFTAAVGAAGAAAYYYMQKKDAALLNETDEDYDDFSEDVDDSASRTYVPLSHENAPEQETAAAPAESASKDNFFTPLAEKVSQAAETVKEKAEETVEEFFDEDAPAEAGASEKFFDEDAPAETGASEEFFDEDAPAGAETSEEFFDDETESAE